MSEAEQYARDVLKYRKPAADSKRHSKWREAAQQKLKGELPPQARTFWQGELRKTERTLTSSTLPVLTREQTRQNFALQVKCARSILMHIKEVCVSLGEGDIHKALDPMYWVGVYHQQLHTAFVDHWTERGRVIEQSAHKGGEGKAVKPEIIRAWKDRAAELRNEDHSRSDLKVAEVIESEFGKTIFAGKVETIRKKI